MCSTAPRTINVPHTHIHCSHLLLHVLFLLTYWSWHASSSARLLKFSNKILLRIIYWARLIHAEVRVSLSVSPKCYVKNIPGYLPCWCELCGTGQVLCLSRVKKVSLKVPPGEILTYVHIYYSCPMCLEGIVMQDIQFGLFVQWWLQSWNMVPNNLHGHNFGVYSVSSFNTLLSECGKDMNKC